jgi:hypothetical protein
VVQGEQASALYEGTMSRGQSARLRLLAGSTIVVDETRSPYADYVESFYGPHAFSPQGVARRHLDVNTNVNHPLPIPSTEHEAP